MGILKRILMTLKEKTEHKCHYKINGLKETGETEDMVVNMKDISTTWL